MRFLLFTLVFFSLYNVVAQQDTTQQGLYNKIISLDEQLRNDPSKLTSNFSPSDTSSLPIGIVRKIGATEYIVAIDSAWFTPDGAFFNVYMAINPPNADKPIAFAAKGIQFNPKGVSVANGAKLQLISQQVVQVGPNFQMVFKNDGQNFVEFDCNGYKLTSLSIDFILNSEKFENAVNPSAPVKAGMQMTVSDINDITYQLQNITPFRLQGAKDFVFNMQNIVVDFSDVSTPSAVPAQYINTATLPNGLPSWTGFYAQNITIDLPNKLSDDNQTTQIYANDMIIDDSGLSGQFGAANVLTAGDMDNAWGFSIDNLSVDIEHNTLVAGNMDGEISIAQLDDANLIYNANIFQTSGDDKVAFNFTVNPADSISFGSTFSTLSISPCSQINIASVGDEFIPSAVLDGDWSVNYSKARFDGIAFQNVHVGTTAPYITSGTFALTTNPNSDPDLLGFYAGLTSVGFTQTSQGDLAFTVGLGMMLGDPNNGNGFSVNTNTRFITNRTMGADNRERFTFSNFAVDDIQFLANTTAFELSGVISIRNDDPTFGDLFYGSLSLRLKKIMDNPVLVSAGFGKFPTYKYWFTEASVPVNIQVVPGMNITSIYGGVQNRVLSNQSNQQLLDRVAGNIPPPQNGNIIPFTPDANQGLLFRAGVGLMGTSEKAFNGEAMLTVAFNANGGFQSIDFDGQAYMMVTRQQRSDPNAKKVQGSIAVGYDHANKVFDASLNASIYFPGTLSGGLNIQVHVDTNDWYFWLNDPINRANLNLANIFFVNTYFLVGTQIAPIPPPPSYVTNLVGAGTIGSLDVNALGTGGGFATGMEFGVNFDREFPKVGTKWRGYVQCNIGGGFDVMMLNVQNAHCSGSTDPVGVNGYYAMGQVYVYLGGSFGLRKYRNDDDQMPAQQPKNTYNVGSLQVAALLQGKLPKPSFIYGAIGLQANILGVINHSFTADVEFGTDCTLVGI